eukprot:jgi/Picre1/35235/NNA_002697.t1
MKEGEERHLNVEETRRQPFAESIGLFVPSPRQGVETRSQAAARLKEERAQQRAAVAEGMVECREGDGCEASPMDVREHNSECYPREECHSQGMESSDHPEGLQRCECLPDGRHESMHIEGNDDDNSPPATPVHQIVRHDPDGRWEPPRAPKKSRLRRIDPEGFAFGFQLSRRLDFEKHANREEK